jgi:DNA uptake protein ComE-like DNA-binding protein
MSLAVRHSGRLLGIATLALVMVAGTSTPARSQVGRQPGMIDPNLATDQELAALPHMTPELVKGIVEHRPFLSMTDLNGYLGQSLSKEQLSALYRTMFVHLNLNTASKEEILLVPGVGNRMLHEFEEYRPYRTLAQFSREIGKYVDDKELARLEGYVFVPVNLNTASDADILTIPGVGNRMLHEFKEYRPYRNLEQFRREIGKYVDEKEVARLERYVTIE